MPVTIKVQKSLYPLEVIYGASYQFIDRCYVRLEQEGSGGILIHLKPKPERSEDAETLSGEFMNELLNQAFRRKVSTRTGRVREMVVQRALYSAAPDPAPADDLGGEDLDFLDDPLGIAVPWEEKYEGSKGDGGRGTEGA
ncbi:MAG: His-Xaa-Ser system protein HxsD [Deltaproteobacteria bacterium]|nr:His-Xaa-Ser system protein HxsD [Deltaproteobacteria bacterium]